jgi:DNA-binding transcriptional LysR family regulator
VYDCAKDVLARYEKTVSELEDMKKTVSGSVRVATVASIGLHVLPPYLEKFQRAYPLVRVQMLYRQTSLVYKEILSNNADFGFVAFPVQRPELETIHFLDDRLVLVVHPNHPLAGHRQVQFSALAGQKFIGWLPGGPVHDVIAQICRDNKIKVDTTMQFDNSETVMSAVEIGAGIALVPAMTAKRAVSRGSLVALEFKNREFVRPLAIIHRKGRVFMPAMRKFIEIMRADLSRKVKA